MRDYDIRMALRSRLADNHRGEDALILDEVRLCQGDARVDLAVINGSLTGYEIKSEHDTLRRLPSQIDLYSQVFDFVTVVVGPRYRDRVRSLLPEWYGLIVATQSDTGVELQVVAEPQRNPDVLAASRAKLLWREEALTILENLGLAAGHRSKPRFKLWSVLAELVPADELNDLVREAVKARGDWRADRQRAPSDAIPSSSPNS